MVVLLPQLQMTIWLKFVQILLSFYELACKNDPLRWVIGV